MTGRIDVHSHLLPGIDDGCRTVEESLRCARRMVEAGYTHSFVTPHVWPHLPNDVASIRGHAAGLRAALEEAGVPLRVMPGGEINLTAGYLRTTPEAVVSYGMGRRHVLFDIWADRLPEFFEPSVRWFQSMGMTAILAHPERMKAVQADPTLADYFQRLGLLLQGNLQCLSDAPGTPTRELGAQFLAEGRYFLLGSDLHREETLQHRLDGLKRAEELVGAEQVWKLTAINPKVLMEAAG